MDYLKALFQKEITKRILTFGVIILFLYLLREMLNLFLLTFIFTYLMYSVQGFLIRKLKGIVHIKQKAMVVILYLTLICIVVFVLYKYIPIMIREVSDVINQIIAIYKKPNDNEIVQYLVSMLNGIDIEGYIGKGTNFVVKSLTNISKWGINIVIALILSLFFLLEKNKIIRFTSNFKTSRVAGIYNEIAFFGTKFLHSFGKVIEAQILISLINSALSVIALWIMGFPQPLGLGIMIFVLGLIPVAGVLISLVPLSMIAFNIGGIMKVVYILIMIAVLHALESYILNPKLMSSKTELPVFYTFIILIVSEQLMGVWGLIIGIPIFIFLLDLLDVKKEC